MERYENINNSESKRKYAVLCRDIPFGKESVLAAINIDSSETDSYFNRVDSRVAFRLEEIRTTLDEKVMRFAGHCFTNEGKKITV